MTKELFEKVALKTNIENTEIKSLMEIITTRLNLNVSKSSVKINKSLLNEVLVENLNNKERFNKIHQCYVKLMDTNNESIIRLVNKLSDDTSSLSDWMVLNYNNITLYDFKNEGKKLSGLSLGAYGGNKSNFNREQQYVVRDILNQNKDIKYSVDVMMGMLGSTLSILPVLFEKGIKPIVNDYNKKTVNMWNRVKEERSSVLNIISDVVREWSVEFGGLTLDDFSDKDSQKRVHKKLLDLVQEKERNNELDIYHGTYLLILSNISFTGNYEVKVEKENRKGKSIEEIEIEKMKGNTVSNYSVSRDPKKYMYVVNRLIKKVETISLLLNICGVEILNKDYKEVIKEYDSINTLVVFDPPYVECQTKYDNTPNFDEVKSCSYNYGLNWTSKEHLDVLDTVSSLKSEVMYWNYKHTVVKHYQMKNNFKELEISFKDGTTCIDKINYLMWSNKKSKCVVNNNSYEVSKYLVS